MPTIIDLEKNAAVQTIGTDSEMYRREEFMNGKENRNLRLLSLCIGKIFVKYRL